VTDGQPPGLDNLSSGTGAETARKSLMFSAHLEHGLQAPAAWQANPLSTDQRVEVGANRAKTPTQGAEKQPQARSGKRMVILRERLQGL
jgi:hypothetical protein